MKEVLSLHSRHRRGGKGKGKMERGEKKGRGMLAIRTWGSDHYFHYTHQFSPIMSTVKIITNQNKVCAYPHE